MLLQLITLIPSLQRKTTCRTGSDKNTQVHSTSAKSWLVPKIIIIIQPRKLSSKQDELWVVKCGSKELIRSGIPYLFKSFKIFESSFTKVHHLSKSCLCVWNWWCKNIRYQSSWNVKLLINRSIKTIKHQIYCNSLADYSTKIHLQW